MPNELCDFSLSARGSNGSERCNVGRRQRVGRKNLIADHVVEGSEHTVGKILWGYSVDR